MVTHMKTEREVVGGRIRAARVLARLSQGELGAFLGLSASTVSLIESGKSSLDLDLVPTLAQRTGQSPSYFIGADSLRDPAGSVPGNFRLWDSPSDSKQVTVQDFENILSGNWLGIQESNLCLTIQSRRPLNVIDLLELP